MHLIRRKRCSSLVPWIGKMYRVKAIGSNGWWETVETVGNDFQQRETMLHGGKQFSWWENIFHVGISCLPGLQTAIHRGPSPMDAWRPGKQDVPPWKMISTVGNGFVPWKMLSHRVKTFPTFFLDSFGPIFWTPARIFPM